MATLKSVSRSVRSDSLRGAFMIDTVRGVIRVRKWPKKRGTPKSALQRWWNDWFTQANYLAKYVDGETAARAIEMTAGSGMYPRDIILSAMRGRLYRWTDQNGKAWNSMAAVQDISDSLDVLGQSIGDLLVRAADRWRPPPAGAVNEVLTHQGAADPPIWKAPAPASAYIGHASAYNTANQIITTGTWTAIKFNAEVADTDVIHDNVTNNTRFTVPAGRTVIELDASLIWENLAGGYRIAQWWKNGAAFQGMPNATQTGVAGVSVGACLPSLPLDVVGGDYFEVIVRHNRGGNTSVLTNAGTWAGMKILK